MKSLKEIDDKIKELEEESDKCVTAVISRGQYKGLRTQIEVMKLLKWVFEDELKIEEGK